MNMHAGPDDTRDLVLPKREDALTVFTTPKAIDPFLDRIRQELDSFEADVSTSSGRKAIASIAYRVAKAKAALDAIGKELADEVKSIPKKVDASRKHIRDTLDAWKDEVRKPLTEWEAAEESRVNGIKAILSELQAVIDDREERPAQALRDRLGEVQAEAITKDRFAEFLAEAVELKDGAIAALGAQIEKAEKREAEAAELERLRREAVEREARDREERIAREASERAKHEAETAAQAERERVEAAARAEREASERRELELKLAAEAAERKAAETEQRLRREAEEARAREQAEAARREEDKKRRAKVHRAAADALVKGGLPEDTAKAVVTLIATRSVPHISISY